MRNIQINSQYVKEGDIFVGISCEHLKHNVMDALNKGAILAFVEKKYKDQLCEFSNIIFVEDSRLIASRLSAFCYNQCPEICVGVTGTNGKSSVVHFLKQIWQYSGKKSANLGTLGLFIGDFKIEPDNLNIPALTTPDCISLHKILEYLKKEDVTHFAFEASSHALEQKRLHSVPIQAAGFTNLASDHLDYHKTKNAYLSSKMRLFKEILPQEKPAILSMDFPEIYESVKVFNKNIITFGLSDKNLIQARNIVEYFDKIKFDLIIGDVYFKDLEVKLFGKFQIMNLLCAVALAYSTGLTINQIVESFEKIKQLEGRMEYIGSHNGSNIYVDYAHTAEGFRNCLETFKRTCKGRLICVFGCGGDRDNSKRSENGKSADELADIVIVTDDNPRTENPESIRKEIIASCPKAIEISDRKEAIKQAINIGQNEDIIVVIGKGHETIQIYKDKVIQHNDKEEILCVLKANK